MKKKLNWLNAQWELDSKESIEKDRSIGMSTRGIFSGANWYEDTPEEHQEMVDYLHLESNDCITELIKK